MSRIPGCVAGLAAALIAVSGCGSSDSKSANGVGDQSGPAGITAQAEGGAGSGASAAVFDVDACELFSAEQVSEVVGSKLAGVEPQKPQGSLLGGCSYSVDAADFDDATVAMAMIHARPAREYQQTVKMYHEKDIPGLGVSAVFGDKIGVLVEMDKPYFLHIAVSGMDAKIDLDLSVALAKAVLARL